MAILYDCSYTNQLECDSINNALLYCIVLYAHCMDIIVGRMTYGIYKPPYWADEFHWLISFPYLIFWLM